MTSKHTLCAVNERSSDLIEAGPGKQPEWSEAAMVLLRTRFFEPEDSTVGKWAERVAEGFVKNYPAAEAQYWQKQYAHLIYFKKFFPTTAALKNGRGRTGPLSGCTVIPLSGKLSELFSSTIPSALRALRSGIGVGFDLTPLLPRLIADPENGRPSPGTNEVVCGIANLASGIIRYNGLKRAAFLASLSYAHPDIFEFIGLKRNKFLDTLNISVAVDDRFSQAVDNNEVLPFMMGGEPLKITELKKCIAAALRHNLPPPDLEVLHSGEIASRSCDRRIIGVEKGGLAYFYATKLLEAIAECAFASGDPGIINLSAINKANPTSDSATSLSKLSKTPGVGKLFTTTPCGEQPLLPNEVCHLGSINLMSFVDGDQFQWNELADTIGIAVRMMDDIVDLSNSECEISNEISRLNRKIGLGIMGLADLLLTLELPYDSAQGRELAGSLVKFINHHAQEESIKLAAERGPFPNWPISQLAKVGARLRRHSTLTTIAPTGHISILAGCSPGIEPYFSLHYSQMAAGERTVTCLPLQKYLDKLNYSLDTWITDTRELDPQYSFNGSLEGLSDNPTGDLLLAKELTKAKQIFKTALQISPSDHLQMVVVLQRHIENGISKTINLPQSTTRREVYQIFLQAMQFSLKGITVFRDGCLSHQALTVHRGCTNCGKVTSFMRNDCGGYVCALENGGCGYAPCEI